MSDIKYEGIYTEERFYIHKNRALWVFINPEAESGNQFVENIFRRSHICRAIDACTKADGTADVHDIFSHIEADCAKYGRQFLWDDEYEDTILDSYAETRELFESEPFATGLTADTLYALLTTLN